MFSSASAMKAISKFHEVCSAHDPGPRLAETLRLSILTAVSEKMSNHDIQRINALIGTPITSVEAPEDEASKLETIRGYLKVCAVTEPFVQTGVLDVADAISDNNQKLIAEWEDAVNSEFMEAMSNADFTNDLTEEQIDELLVPVRKAVIEATDRVFETQ